MNNTIQYRGYIGSVEFSEEEYTVNHEYWLIF